MNEEAVINEMNEVNDVNEMNEFMNKTNDDDMTT